MQRRGTGPRGQEVDGLLRPASSEKSQSEERRSSWPAAALAALAFENGLTSIRKRVCTRCRRHPPHRLCLSSLSLVCQQSLQCAQASLFHSIQLAQVVHCTSVDEAPLERNGRAQSARRLAATPITLSSLLLNHSSNRLLHLHHTPCLDEPRHESPPLAPPPPQPPPPPPILLLLGKC